MDNAARWTARLEIIAPLTLLACGLWVFVFAPTETEQGFVQKSCTFMYPLSLSPT